MDNPLISIVSPVYGASACLPELCNRLVESLESITSDFEILLVEDYSPDDSWQVLKQMSKSNHKIKCLRFSRNFGQHYAIAAGLRNAKGKWVVVMDCDLQDQPEEIQKLYSKAQEGFEIVFARRSDRKDGIIKRTFSRIFYSVLAYLSDVEQDHEIANFGIYHKKVITQINHMPEKVRFFPTMVNWTGFRKTSVTVEHAQRSHGKSSYNFRKLLKLALDVILANSDKPMRLMLKLGFSVATFSFISAIWVSIRAINNEIPVMGYASLIVSIWLFSGLIIFMLGLTGLYIGKIFSEVKDKPIYIVDESINL